MNSQAPSKVPKFCLSCSISSFDVGDFSVRFLLGTPGAAPSSSVPHRHEGHSERPWIQKDPTFSKKVRNWFSFFPSLLFSLLGTLESLFPRECWRSLASGSRNRSPVKTASASRGQVEGMIDPLTSKQRVNDRGWQEPGNFVPGGSENDFRCWKRVAFSERWLIRCPYLLNLINISWKNWRTQEGLKNRRDFGSMIRMGGGGQCSRGCWWTWRDRLRLSKTVLTRMLLGERD